MSINAKGYFRDLKYSNKEKFSENNPTISPTSLLKNDQFVLQQDNKHNKL